MSHQKEEYLVSEPSYQTTKFFTGNLLAIEKRKTQENIKRESTDLKYLNDSKAFIEYSNNIDDIYKNIEEYNPSKRY